MDGKSRLLHARVLYHVHVVEPDVLHAPGEVLPRPQALADLQEVVQSTDVDLTFTRDTISQLQYGTQMWRLTVSK